MAERGTVALHIGSVHDGAMELVSSLRRNSELLAALGISVRRPRFYRRRLQEVAEDPGADPATSEQIAEIWQAFPDDSIPRHAFLNMPSLIGPDEELIRDGSFLPGAAIRPTAVRRYLDQVDCTFFLGLVNPATMISRALATIENPELAATLASIQPAGLSWTNVITRLQQANPSTPIVVWTREELPFTWPQLMHRAAGLDSEVLVHGTADGLRELLPAEAKVSLEEYIQRKDMVDHRALARVFDVYLKHFVKPDNLTEVIEVPGWTAEVVNDITRHYRSDVAEIGRMSGVTLLTV
ncbi:hypothetical protein [Chachezhania sediminis]|uniref:hypothetical protein n=1 Tax=Chachezhania sediminis TaxID=2599291 RepID=UPI00131DAFF5|nr:hypothetical protein [Chachezhania sediminis]